MNETRASCKDCQNRTPERFCKWLGAFLQAGLDDDVGCEGFLHNESIVQQKRGKDKPVDNGEVSRVPCPKTDSTSVLKRSEKTMILKALELRSIRGARIYWEKVRCGKRNCRCSRGSPHGPYAYLRWFEAGRWRKRYLGKDLAVLMSKTREELEARLSQVDEILGQGSPSGSRPSETSSGEI